MKNVVKKKFKFADTSMLYQYNESVDKIVMKIRLRTKKIHVNLKSIKVINNCTDG